MTTRLTIQCSPDIMLGQPTIYGTRIGLDLILRKLHSGMTAEAILVDHPRLDLDSIRVIQALQQLNWTLRGDEGSERGRS